MRFATVSFVTGEVSAVALCLCVFDGRECLVATSCGRIIVEVGMDIALVNVIACVFAIEFNVCFLILPLSPVSRSHPLSLAKPCSPGFRSIVGGFIIIGDLVARVILTALLIDGIRYKNHMRVLPAPEVSQYISWEDPVSHYLIMVGIAKWTSRHIPNLPSNSRAMTLSWSSQLRGGIVAESMNLGFWFNQANDWKSEAARSSQ